MTAQEYVVVQTTVGKKADAEEISKRLLEERLVACAQIFGPISSTYWWKGVIENAQEWLCIMKSRASLFDQIEKMVKSLHPYETPELIALPISDGSDEYLEWMEGALKRSDPKT
jgi:periplasmic divalent cation tolerance protein